MRRQRRLAWHIETGIFLSKVAGLDVGTRIRQVAVQIRRVDQTFSVVEEVPCDFD
jgi:hypothetical protein